MSEFWEQVYLAAFEKLSPGAYRIAIDTADQAVAALAKSEQTKGEPDAPGGWISVEDRVPERDKDVLVHAPANGTYPAQIAVAYLCGNVGRWAVDVGVYLLVTHWMPLPEPPEATP